MSAVFYTDENGIEYSLGTGFSINENGYILTARHVIGGAERIQIILPNGTVYDVFQYGTAQDLDLAILKVESGLPPVDLLEEGVLEVGSDIGFIGFPLGLAAPTKTKGSITLVAPPIYVINSFINKGNSGGPVFSLKTGKVVGIINAVDLDKTGIGISTIINKKALSPSGVSL